MNINYSRYASLRMLVAVFVLQSFPISATVLDELKERRNTVGAAQSANYRTAVATGLLTPLDILWRIVATPLTAHLAWHSDLAPPFACDTCHDADGAIHKNRIALRNIMNAVKFLKETERAYRHMHFPKKGKKGFTLDNYSDDFRKTLSEISFPMMTEAQIIDAIHLHNQAGMGGLVSRNDIVVSTTRKGAAQYVAPDYLRLIKDYVIAALPTSGA